jgi:phosphatidylserine/phosphatidylglycerophosphate/cardiolipin synthase-like enzyme
MGCASSFSGPPPRPEEHQVLLPQAQTALPNDDDDDKNNKDDAMREEQVAPIPRTTYNKKSRFATLTVTVHAARGLLSKDSNGLSDPYVRVIFGQFEHRTRVIPCNLNPVWDPAETFTFSLYLIPNNHPFYLKVLLFDDDSIAQQQREGVKKPQDVGSDDFLGQVEIELPLIPGSLQRHWYLLRQRSSRSHVAGEVQLSLSLTGFDTLVTNDFRQATTRPGSTAVMGSDDDEATSRAEDLPTKPLSHFAPHRAHHHQGKEFRPRPWPPCEPPEPGIFSTVCQAQLVGESVPPWYRVNAHEEFALLRVDESTPVSAVLMYALLDPKTLVLTNNSSGAESAIGGVSLWFTINGYRRVRLLFRDDGVVVAAQLRDLIIMFHAKRADIRYGSPYDTVACDAKQIEMFGCGMEYYSSLVNELENAKEMICIADWYLSPEVHLKRDILPLDPRFRLDNLLKRKAEEGVLIYVLVFDDRGAIGLESERAVKVLQGLHENIFALKHAPRDIKDVYFSHHQKFVVCDYKTCFIGGIDLCFGRYDEPNHPVVDFFTSPFVWPGADYYNPRLVPHNNLDKPLMERADRARHPRLPWQDIHAKFCGEVAYDLFMLFTQRWTHHRLQVTNGKIKRRTPVLAPPTRAKVLGEPAPGGGASTAQLLRSVSTWSGELKNDTSIYQAMVDKIAHAEKYIYIEQQFFITSCDDEQRELPVNTRLEVLGAPFMNSMRALLRTNKSAAKRVRGFLASMGRLGVITEEGSDDENDDEDEEAGESNSTDAPAALPETAEADRGPGLVERTLARVKMMRKNRPHVRENVRRLLGRRANAQLTRETDHRTLIYNKVGQALFRRLCVAIENEEEFCVVVVLPDYPEGHFQKEKYTQAVMHYQAHSICLGKDSLLGRLIDKYPNAPVANYVQFFNLRSFGFYGIVPLQECVYVHSKLMLIDDKHCIVGSANINDRSLLGVRDSECAILLENCEEKLGAFRKLLWSRHLGIPSPEDESLVNAVKCFREEWHTISSINTATFEKVWPDLPSSKHPTLSSILSCDKGPLDPSKLVGIKGFVVDHPMFFLSGEANLLPPLNKKEGALVEYTMFQ